MLVNMSRTNSTTLSSHIQQKTPLLIQLLRVLDRAVVLQSKFQVIGKKTGRHWHKEDEFDMIAHNEDTHKKRTHGSVKEHADQQTLLGVVPKRLPVLCRHLRVANMAILGKALCGHKKCPHHPISQGQRQRRQLIGQPEQTTRGKAAGDCSPILKAHRDTGVPWCAPAGHCTPHPYPREQGLRQRNRDSARKPSSNQWRQEAATPAQRTSAGPTLMAPVDAFSPGESDHEAHR